MDPHTTRKLRWTLLILALASIVLTRTLWLGWMGNALVTREKPFHADMIVVLAGDDHGNRILKGAELVRQGYAPKVLVDGPYCCYGHVESDVAIPFAVRHGYPPDWFTPFPIKGSSTTAEAAEVVAELNRRHAGHFLVVTSDYHTRRAERIFRRLVPADRFRTIAARDWAFQEDNWWRSRDGRKQAFFEWSKTVADWAGL